MTPLRPGAGPPPLRTATMRLLPDAGAEPDCQPEDTASGRCVPLMGCASLRRGTAHVPMGRWSVVAQGLSSEPRPPAPKELRHPSTTTRRLATGFFVAAPVFLVVAGGLAW